MSGDSSVPLVSRYRRRSRCSAEVVCFGFADQLELIAAVADLDGQALFDQAQMLVELPAQIGEAASFKRLEDKTMWFDGCVQGRI